MTRQATWARGEAPTIEEAGQERLRTEVAAERLRVRAVGHLPLDHDAARLEQSEERRALRASRPKTRRWRGLAKIDAEVDRLTQRLTEAGERVRQAEELVQQAPDHDTQAVAHWLAAGERGERPAAAIYDRERDQDASRILADGIAAELDRVLEQRVGYVEKHREKMIADARKDVAEARDQLLEHARRLPELRSALLNARELLAWTASYPDPVESFGFPTAAALGLRQPIEETLQTKARVDYQALVDALEADADALATAFARATKEKLGTAEERTPLTDAMWDSEVSPKWKREQLERAKAIAAYAINPAAVAQEASDFRPDP